MKQMSEFWNERYAVKEYVYGTDPNEFLKGHLEKLSPGRILFPAEGEGRNAVFAAQRGWEVFAFDSSSEARVKAKNLASEKEVSIKYQVESLEHVHYPPEEFDCIALIFAHFQPDKRKSYHQKLLTFLKPKGTIILVGFSKNQIKNNSGGPRNIEMLFSEEELKSDFQSLSELKIQELETELDEGTFHLGNASVIHMIGFK
jgi:SAM-dependent methyltransferase